MLTLKKIKSPLAVCVVINLLVALGVVLFQNHLPPVVPLFYGRPLGEEQLAQQIFLILPPAIASLLCVLNFLISPIFNDKFLKNMLIGLGVVATLLSSITVIKISLLVGSL